MKRKLFYRAGPMLLLASLALMLVYTPSAKAVGLYGAYSPYRIGSTVYSEGWYCNSYPVSVSYEVVAQRKVCGFWGCSYEDKGSSRVTLNPSQCAFRRVPQPCIKGTHRYRTEVVVRHWTLFGLQTDVGFGDSAPEFTCL